MIYFKLKALPEQEYVLISEIFTTRYALQVTLTHIQNIPTILVRESVKN
jgi:hypothetical protein